MYVFMSMYVHLMWFQKADFRFALKNKMYLAEFPELKSVKYADADTKQ